MPNYLTRLKHEDSNFEDLLPCILDHKALGLDSEGCDALVVEDIFQYPALRCHGRLVVKNRLPAIPNDVAMMA